MADDEIRSLITDEHRATIGVESEPVTVTVREADARRLRDLLEDDDPRYADGTGIAPPYVIATLGNAVRRETPNVLPSGLMTQQEWKFSRPFRIGEELTAISQVSDMRDRLGGRYGYSILLTTTTDYYDADGKHVAAVMLTITQFDPAGARGNE